jgi:hypothetical protein
MNGEIFATLTLSYNYIRSDICFFLIMQSDESRVAHISILHTAEIIFGHFVLLLQVQA